MDKKKDGKVRSILKKTSTKSIEESITLNQVSQSVASSSNFVQDFLNRQNSQKANSKNVSQKHLLAIIIRHRKMNKNRIQQQIKTSRMWLKI